MNTKAIRKTSNDSKLDDQVAQLLAEYDEQVAEIADQTRNLEQDMIERINRLFAQHGVKKVAASRLWTETEIDAYRPAAATELIEIAVNERQ